MTTIPTQDGTVLSIAREFQIKATASGGSVAWKAVTANIIVCGLETVGLIDSSKIVYSLAFMETPVAHQYTIKSNFTSSDSDCMPTQFSITMDTSDTAPTSEALYKIIDDNTVSEPKLWLNPATAGTSTFYVRGTSIGGSKAYKEVDFEIFNGCATVPPVITLAEAGTKAINFAKNGGIQSIFTANQISALFVLDDATRCPLQTFEVIASDGSEITSSYDLYTRLDLVNRPADQSL